MAYSTCPMTSILNEIPRESLQNLLSSVRVRTSPSGCHVPPATENAASLPLLSSLGRGRVIEVQGPPSSGKTHLLYHFVLLCISPSKEMSMDFGGNGLAAVVYDADSSFDVARLHRLLLTRFSLIIPYNMEMARQLAEQSLRRLHVFRPTSLLQLATSLIHLPHYHMVHIPEHEIGLVAVDSISAFYWPDLFIAEQIRNVPQFAQGVPEPASVHPLQHVLTALGRIRQSYVPLIILTNWGLNPAWQSSGEVSFYKQHLHPFPRFSEDDDANTLSSSVLSDLLPTPDWLPLTHHITLSPVPVPPFRPELSLDDVIKQEVEYRRRIVQKGEIKGLVRTTGSRETCHLTFCITSENVDVRYSSSIHS